ncbi:MAG: hypothetical protein JST54_00755 [Deltaproteobacteria bacterium]|nr:hypothetical protein [Deltaproteobacteria bacterium]
MFSDRFSLPFVTSVLIAAAERRRPGLGPWTPAVRQELLGIFKDELASVKKSYDELAASAGTGQEKDDWENLEHAVLHDAFPRYAAVAEKETALEQNEYGVWRGGDLLARLAYAGGGLVIGGLCVKLPFIPIPTEWDFFAFLTMIGAPLIPDMQVAWHKRRFRKKIEAIMEEMAAAAEAQKLYQPLGLTDDKPQPVADVASAEEGGLNGSRTKESEGNR